MKEARQLASSKTPLAESSGGTWRDEAKSSADHAYEVIRNAILDSTLAPGARLTTRGMAELAGVSVIPVVQALHRLENEGLIETFPRWGSRVITLDRETIRDRYLLREAVECQVARELAAHLTTDQADELTRQAEKLDRLLLEKPQTDEYWENDYAIHTMMAHFTGSKSLQKSLAHVNLFRLHQKAREELMLKHIQLPARLHRDLVEAILSRDPDVAEKAMRDHIYAPNRRWLDNFMK